MKRQLHPHPGPLPSRARGKSERNRRFLESSNTESSKVLLFFPQTFFLCLPSRLSVFALDGVCLWGLLFLTLSRLLVSFLCLPLWLSVFVLDGVCLWGL